MDEGFSKNLVCAVGDDLVGVHVALGSASGLPDDKWEVLQKAQGDDLVAGLCDGRKLFPCHFVGDEAAVDQGCGLFQDSEGTDYLAWHRLDTDSDFEVLMTSLSLCSPELIGRNLYRSH